MAFNKAMYSAIMLLLSRGNAQQISMQILEPQFDPVSFLASPRNAVKDVEDGQLRQIFSQFCI